jgi:N-acetylglucosaminyldiphosphoundecaprenol N-acetyl-beta-D-mannosaminyltransferase
VARQSVHGRDRGIDLLASRRVEIFGAPVDAVSLHEAVGWIEQLVASGDNGQHAALNAGKIVRFAREPELLAAIRDCELVTADGQAVVWAARLLGRPLPERVAGIDLMEALFARAEARGLSVYLLGARPEVIRAAEAEIARRHPKLRIAGRHHGYFGAEAEDSVVADIAQRAPDLLFIALETPQKELFIARNRDRLKVPFAMGVGGSFDVLAGRRQRAPMWMQRAGLEWLFRLIQEPGRLGRRYMFGNAAFTALVIRELVSVRIIEPWRARR